MKKIQTMEVFKCLKATLLHPPPSLQAMPTLEIETDKQTKVESSGSEPSVVWGKEDTAHTKQSIREMTDNILMDSISEHDRIKDAVNRRLMDEVVANYDKFIKGLQHVNEVDMDLTRASLFVKSARKELLFSRKPLCVIAFG